MACGLVLAMLIRVGTQVKVAQWIAESQVEISWLRGDPHLHVTAIATLVAMLDLMSSGMKTAKACAQYGKGGCGRDERSMGSVREERGAGLVCEADWYSPAQPARLLLLVD